MEHTPTPYKIMESIPMKPRYQGETETCLVDAANRNVLNRSNFQEQLANQDFVVIACNNYGPLLATALEIIRSWECLKQDARRSTINLHDQKAESFKQAVCDLKSVLLGIERKS